MLQGRSTRIGVGNSSGSNSTIFPKQGEGSPIYSRNLTLFPTSFTIDSQNRRICSTWNILVALVILLTLFLTGCGKLEPEVKPLVVGMDLSYPPFEMIDEKGQPAGVSVEIAEALAQSLNRPLKIENIPFVGLIPSLQNGRLDCVISSMTATEERRASLDFSDAYLKIGLALLVTKDSPIQSPADLDQLGHTVIVRQGTTGEVWARANFKQAKILPVDKENSAVLEVIGKKGDAFIYDQMSVWQNQQKNPTETRAILTPLKTEEWAIGIRKGNDELRAGVNTFLQKFRSDGGFDRLAEKYLKAQKQAFQEQGVPFVF